MFELLEEIRIAQLNSWLAGERASVESFFDRHPTLREDAETAVDLIYSEILLREHLGEVVAWNEYLARFPAYATTLKRQHELHELFRRDLVIDSNSLILAPRSRDLEVPFDEQATRPLRPPKEKKTEAPFPMIPGFVIEAKLGSGGCGVVYRATQIGLGRTVALKVLRNVAAPEPEELELFQREAAAVARLQHSQVVQIHLFDVHEGRPFIVMEYVQGGGLDRWPAGKPMAPRAAAELLVSLARAVQTVHEQGIIHRDLKPGNVLLGENGIPKIADFGLAKDLGAGVSLFQSGAIIGTPAYMAPEQAGGRSSEIGEATDVYALGAILYEALTGRPPFGEGNALDVLELVKTRMPEKPSRLRPDVPRDLENICMKCLAKNPKDRYASATALADDVERYLNGTLPPPPHWARRLVPGVRRRAWIGMGMAIATFAAALLITFAGYHPKPAAPEPTIPEILDRTGSYTFIGAKGPPKTFRWSVLEGTVQPLPPDAEGFTFESLRYCPIELLGNPGRDRYRFSAKVRHDQKRNAGQVGIAFGLKTYPTPDGNVVYSCLLGFTELRTSPTQPDGTTVPNHLGLQIQCNAITGQPCFITGVGKLLRFEPISALFGQGPWRGLVVEVRPNSIRTFWEGIPISDVTPDELAIRCHGMVKNAQRTFKNAQLLAAVEDARFDPHGGLGLFVENGSATFKDVVLETLPEE